jgi:hypothetical protein
VLGEFASQEELLLTATRQSTGVERLPTIRFKNSEIYVDCKKIFGVTLLY